MITCSTCLWLYCRVMVVLELNSWRKCAYLLILRQKHFIVICCPWNLLWQLSKVCTNNLRRGWGECGRAIPRKRILGSARTDQPDTTFPASRKRRMNAVARTTIFSTFGESWFAALAFWGSTWRRWAASPCGRRRRSRNRFWPVRQSARRATSTPRWPRCRWSLTRSGQVSNPFHQYFLLFEVVSLTSNTVAEVKRQCQYCTKQVNIVTGTEAVEYWHHFSNTNSTVSL